MRKDYLRYIVCPECGGELQVKGDETFETGRIDTGSLDCQKCGASYDILNSIPRFVSSENYAKNFGFQWLKHSRTQYDKEIGDNVSKRRFFEASEWDSDLHGQVILEVGCGSGRFTEHAASTGAFVVSFDYSNAVEANYLSNGMKDNVFILQADIYKMPFRKSFFDKVFCFGVLQHTPDVERSFLALPEYLKEGGRLAIDVYRKDAWIKQMFKTRYWVRPVTKNMRVETLYHILQKYINLMWPIVQLIHKMPFGRHINKAMFIPDYIGMYDTEMDVLKEWAILDSFDMLSPQYDQPQSIEDVKGWFSRAGLKGIEVKFGHNGIEGRGEK
jgi:SAM-dependent methyltransferase